MALDYLQERVALDDDAARLEQIFDVDVAHVEGAAPVGHEVEGVEQGVAAVGGDEGAAAGAAAPAVEVEDLLDPAGAEGLLELGGAGAAAAVAEAVGALEQGREVGGQGQLHAVLAHDQLAAAVAVRERGPPGEVVHLARDLGAEVARLGAEGLASAAAQGRLLAADTGAAQALLRVQLAVRAVHLPPRLRGGGALPRVVALVDHG